MNVFLWLLMAGAAEPDCLCGHSWAWHQPRPLLGPRVPCRRRRRARWWHLRGRPCLCGDYEPELPRLGGHLRVWGPADPAGWHACSADQPHDGPCTCLCGATAP